MRLLPVRPTFQETYIDYETEFKNNYGRTKFREIFDTIINSATVKKLIDASIKQNVAPSGKHFAQCILSMRYFLFAKSDTRAMGAIIALYVWNEQVNSLFNFSDRRSLCDKIEDIFLNLGMYP